MDKAALARDSKHKDLQDMTIDGAQSRSLCVTCAKLSPRPESVTDGKFNVYTQKWGSASRYVRFYLPAAAIAKRSQKAKDGIDGSSQIHMYASCGDGTLHYRRDWCGCESCMRHELRMSPGCKRKQDVGMPLRTTIHPAARQQGLQAQVHSHTGTTIT